MADPITTVVVSMPAQLFTRPDVFSSVANGKIYIGQVDTDPTDVGNQIQVYIQNEDDSTTPVPQPLRTNVAGYPVYNGQIVKFVTTQGYSMTVQSALGVQLFYYANVLKYDPAQLQSRLSSPADGDGDAMVAAKQPYNNSKARTVHDKVAESITMFDFANITGDGIANDTVGLTGIEANSIPYIIDGLDKTYVVNAVPTVNRYVNGWWLVGGSRIPFDYTGHFRGNKNIIAIGPNAAPLINGARNCIAIGEDTLRNNVFGRHNIAIGISAGMFLNGLSASSIEGSRNTLIGGNSGRFISTGNRNIIFGRDAGHNITTGSLNVIIGNGSVMGDGPNTLNPGVIENQTPLTPTSILMMGTEAGKYFNAANAVGIGAQALLNVKTDTGIVGIGNLAFSMHQSDLSYWGTNQTVGLVNCTYSQVGSTLITVTSPAHGLSTNFRVLLRFLSGPNADVTFNDDNWFIITVTGTDTFTIQSPVVSTSSGSASYSKVSTTTTYTKLTGGCVGIGREVGNGNSNYRSTGIGDRTGALGLGVENTGIGFQVFNGALPGAGNTAIGAYSQASSTGAGNTSVGVLSLTSSTTGTNNTASGAQALRFNTTGSNNTAVGSGSLRSNTTGGTNTAIGVDAGRFNVAGADANYNNTTTIGFNAKVSGDNQVQIGDPNTTTYVFGTVQNRSDINDKADVENSVLGIDFVNGLRPVSGKWNLRDDYYVYTEIDTGVIDQNGHPVTKTEVTFDEEGYRAETKKRKRLHQWFIAQEVSELIEKLGLNPDDYGMLQHAAVNGGADVFTLGYDEFIPPVVKAVQDCWSRMDDLEERIKALESK